MDGLLRHDARLAHHQRILIVHDLPAYRLGLVFGLKEAGFEVHDADSTDPLGDSSWQACLLPSSAEDVAALARTKERWPGLPIISLLNEPTVAGHRAALRAGADGLVAHDADITEIVGVLRAALRGATFLPSRIARALAEPEAAVPEGLGLDPQAIGWLGALSRGASVADIARAADYSERQMYRLIQDTYRKIGARNRSEAIVIATRWGVIGVPAAKGSGC
ncbi:hypothetical protein [Amycolatopsis sp. NPDC059021]|uniref:hypothetical protein n=1 Tax=Amycolatopsis sp. NPDC059021 TaxID=3346704 RepID=UPI00366E8BB1